MRVRGVEIIRVVSRQPGGGVKVRGPVVKCLLCGYVPWPPRDGPKAVAAWMRRHWAAGHPEEYRELMANIDSILEGLEDDEGGEA